MRIKLKAELKEGELRFCDSHLFNSVKRKWIGKLLEVDVGVIRKDRSNRQNRYYWGVVVKSVQAFMMDNDGEKVNKAWVHAYHMQEVLGIQPEVKVILGREVLVFEEKRLSERSTVEFEEAMEQIRAFWAHKGLDIAMPNEDNFLEDIFSN